MIAAVEGSAAGAGFSLALACDFIVAPDNAVFVTVAEKLNELAPNALASIKELINYEPSNTVSQQMASELDHFVRNLHHANAGEGIEAFLQKRASQFR